MSEAGEATKPDIKPEDKAWGDRTVAEHAQARMNEYAAIVHFIGLLASGDEEALATFREVLSDVINDYAQQAGSFSDMLGNFYSSAGTSLAGGLMRGASGGLPPSYTFDANARKQFEKGVKYWSDLKATIIAAAKEMYAQTIKIIKEGRVMEAIAKLAIDASLWIGETAAAIALAGALGLGPGIIPILKSIRILAVAVKEGVKEGLERAATRFAIHLHRTDRLVNDAIWKGEIDVEKDLVDAEKDILSPHNQGTTVRDPEYQKEAGGGDKSKSEDADGKKDEDANSKKPERLPNRDVPCFDGPPNRAQSDEFNRQLAEQQHTINNMTADEMAAAHVRLERLKHEWRQSGRKGSSTDKLRDKAAQDQARKKFEKQLEAAGKSPGRIEAIMNSVNATHILDIIGGGDPRKLSVGDAAINQLIGPQWNLNNRAGTLWEEAEKMQAAGLGDMKMEHISLNACK